MLYSQIVAILSECFRSCVCAIFHTHLYMRPFFSWSFTDRLMLLYDLLWKFQMKILVDTGKADLAAEDCEGQTPILIAVKCGNDAVRWKRWMDSETIERLFWVFLQFPFFIHWCEGRTPHEFDFSIPVCICRIVNLCNSFAIIWYSTKWITESAVSVPMTNSSARWKYFCSRIRWYLFIYVKLHAGPKIGNGITWKCA